MKMQRQKEACFNVYWILNLYMKNKIQLWLIGHNAGMYVKHHGESVAALARAKQETGRGIYTVVGTAQADETLQDGREVCSERKGNHH